jgi:hypothetical protein
MYPSDYYTVLAANASAFSAPTLYQASNTYFNSSSLNDQRWGIYSTAVADPNNASGFWLSNEYVSTAVTGPGGSPGSWNTVTAQVLVGGGAPVDQDTLPEVPALTISNTSPTVQAGGSVALGITATPIDSDDQLSVTISGVPSYESITASAGYSVTNQLQSNGTYTWTVTESSSQTGTALTGLSLKSQYTGTGHPVATLTVTASNVTSGETGASRRLPSPIRRRPRRSWDNRLGR